MRRCEIEYQTTSYDVGRATLVALPTFIISTLLLLLIGVKLGSPWIFVIGWVGLCTVPFFYQKKFKLAFTRKVSLIFNEVGMTVNEFGKKNCLLKKKTSLRWADIKAYKCYFSASNVTFITLYPHRGLPKNFFFNDKDQETAVVQESVFSIFYAFVSNHNSLKLEENKINFRVGFFTTTVGLIVILTLLLIAIGLITYFMMYRPKAITTSFLGLVITLALYGKRRKDMRLKTMMENMKPIETV